MTLTDFTKDNQCPFCKSQLTKGFQAWRKCINEKCKVRYSDGYAYLTWYEKIWFFWRLGWKNKVAWVILQKYESCRDFLIEL